jgi:hypothetical protein
MHLLLSIIEGMPSCYTVETLIDCETDSATTAFRITRLDAATWYARHGGGAGLRDEKGFSTFWLAVSRELSACFQHVLRKARAFADSDVKNLAKGGQLVDIMIAPGHAVTAPHPGRKATPVPWLSPGTALAKKPG